MGFLMEKLILTLTSPNSYVNGVITNTEPQLQRFRFEPWRSVKLLCKMAGLTKERWYKYVFSNCVGGTGYFVVTNLVLG